MKSNLQTKEMPKENKQGAAALAAGRCTEFFIGWLERFGNTLKLFVFPFNEEYPNF